MSGPGEVRAPDIAETAIWQDCEFGSYTADLPLWVELAEAAGGPVLELGAGAGRVAIHLAGRGFELIPLERDPDLAAELERRSESGGSPLTALRADLAAPEEISPPHEPQLVIAPLHVLQSLDPAARARLLQSLGRALGPGARLAAALVDESTLLNAGVGATQILPDMREVDGWVYSSEPLWVQMGDETLTVRRIRERVSPDGEMERGVHDEVLHRLSPERLEAEASEAGFSPAGRRPVSAGPNEADSIVVLLEAR
jgi:SAM-dependent methyltransferase